ncbi:M64 family metallopeptidase [Thermophagus xiamenensis]|uniref:Peptidase M64 N-terminus n=1 Tax=Thermophagus xiamenensis TaxID=385682 RepID=A0A1I2F2M9_9BACT|nr:M64 family metallopeptidase [Thermophagus xiamenensis]SFE99233.1 Peptidase M64 N-terminus [Thermophagus xiamenensis]
MLPSFKHIALYFYCLLQVTYSIGQNHEFFNYNQTLRIDFVLSGNYNQQKIAIAHFKKISGYSGNQHQNLPPFDYGTYRLVLLDGKTQDTLFIKGFCTLFEEWRVTTPAQQVVKAFEQTIEAPWPLNDVYLIFEARNKSNSFKPLLREKFSPHKSPIMEVKTPDEHPIKLLHGKNKPSQQTDLLILAEGYTRAEKNQFFIDAKKMSNYLLGMKPYSQLKNKITIRARFIASPETGTDIPSKQIWRQTPMNSSFSTFGSERYLESFSTWTIYDYAAGVPHDHIVLLVNSDKYGGGGVYNHFSITSARNKHSNEVFVHELGHGLAGLADEYYYDDNSDFYDLNHEPWNPNITTLIAFDKKWKHLIADNVPVPTPPLPQYESATGVFEGAGYSAKGIYRPAFNCRMKSNDAEGFCEVCQKAIAQMVKFYAGKNK